MPTNRRGAYKDTLAALYGLLNVVALTTVAPGGVHHAQAPRDLTTDYVVIQAPLTQRWDSMQTPGEQSRVRIEAVTRKPDYGQALAMLAVVIQLVDGERPAIANHLVIQLRWEDTQAMPDPELVNGVPTWKAVATFTLLVDQVA